MKIEHINAHVVHRTAFMTIFILIGLSLSARTEISRQFIEFTDKKNNRFSINNPAEFLSQRAIERREKYGIVITEQDLPVSQDYITQIEEMGFKVTHRIKWLNGVLCVCDDPTKLENVRRLPFIKNTRRVDGRGIKKRTESDKFPKRTPFFKDSKYFNNIYRQEDTYQYGYASKQIKMLHGDYLHNNDYNGSGKVIGVIDAGFENANRLQVFDSLWQNGQILGYKDFVEPDQPDTSIFREHYHGTLVLSAMGAYTSGFVGTAPKAKYWLLRSEDADTEKIEEEYFWADAAEFCDSVGVDIINSSLGYTTFDNPRDNHRYEDMDGKTTPCAKAANKAFESGIAVISSAGNSGSPDNEWHYIGTPADALGALTIGAVDTNGRYVSFSSYGPSFDNRVKPDMCANGYYVRAVYSNGDIDFSSGTSISTPVIAGLIACLWQAKDDHTVQELYDLVRENSHLSNNPNDSLGFGIPSFSGALDGSNIWKHKSVLHSFSLRSEVFFTRSFHSTLVIQFNKLATYKVTIGIFSINGKKIYTKSIRMNTNSAIHRIDDLQAISTGAYILLLDTGKELCMGKIYKY